MKCVENIFTSIFRDKRVLHEKLMYHSSVENHPRDLSLKFTSSLSCHLAIRYKSKMSAMTAFVGLDRQSATIFPSLLIDSLK